MAITVVGAAQSGSAANGGDVTLTFTGSPAADDVVYVGAAVGTSGVTAPTISTAGYVDIANDGLTRPNSISTIFRKKLTGAATTVTIVGSGAPQDTTVAVAIVLRGVNLSTHEDATPTQASGSSTNPDAASITTVTDNAWVLDFAFSPVNDAAVTAPSGYTAQANAANTDANPISGAVASKEKTTAGAENPGTYTAWLTGAWNTFTVAVRPATAAVGRSYGFIIG